MARRPTTALGVLVLGALAVCGCGGGGGSAKTTTTATGAASSSVTHAQFAAQATRICEGVVRKDEPLQKQEESLKHQSLSKADQEFVSLADQAAAIARTADAQLRALAKPAAEAMAIEALLRAYSEQATDAANIAKAAARQDSTLGEAATRALARSIAVNDADAKKYGLGDCLML